jgi:hypothetical protein
MPAAEDEDEAISDDEDPVPDSAPDVPDAPEVADTPEEPCWTLEAVSALEPPCALEDATTSDVAPADDPGASDDAPEAAPLLAADAGPDEAADAGPDEAAEDDVVPPEEDVEPAELPVSWLVHANEWETTTQATIRRGCFKGLAPSSVDVEAAFLTGMVGRERRGPAASHCENGVAGGQAHGFCVDGVVGTARIRWVSAGSVRARANGATFGPVV